MTFIGQIGRQTGTAADHDVAPDLKQRIDDLLLIKLSRLKLPEDIKALFKKRMRTNIRKTTSAWCLWVGGLIIVNSLFDLFMVPPSLIHMVIGFRLILAGSLILASWLFHRGHLTRFAPIYIGLPCILCIVFAGIAGLATQDPGLLTRYLNEAFIVVATAIIFVGLDLRFSFGLAAITIPLIVAFLSCSNLRPIAAQLQIASFDACAIIAIIYGRYVQILVLTRLFLLNMRDDLRNSEARARHAQLSSIAYTDPLTEVATRRYFDEICASMSETTKNLLPLSICMIDIDYFKKLNDSLGHLQGDRCLKLVAATIRNNLRKQADIAARFGGEEFVLLLPNTDMNTAYEVAERIRGAIMDLEHANPGSPVGVVTASIGVAELAKPPLALQTLLQNADLALYRAKVTGRNRVST